jgi:hypothetical protein
MWSMYSWAMLGPVTMIVQGRKTAALEHPWSTMVSIVSFPLCFGRLVITVGSKTVAMFGSFGLGAI